MPERDVLAREDETNEEALTHQKRNAAQAREACQGRQGDSCIRCGIGLSPEDGHVHHRRRRRTLGPEALWCSCGVVLACVACHGWIHANPSESREQGWIVSDMTDQEQRDVPIWTVYPWRGWSLLGCDGLVRSA